MLSQRPATQGVLLHLFVARLGEEVGRKYVVSREARGNRVRWKGVCTWYLQCGFCWLSSVCVLEVIYIKK